LIEVETRAVDGRASRMSAAVVLRRRHLAVIEISVNRHHDAGTSGDEPGLGERNELIMYARRSGIDLA
jgi:hypothetical protein